MSTTTVEAMYAPERDPKGTTTGGQFTTNPNAAHKSEQPPLRPLKRTVRRPVTKPAAKPTSSGGFDKLARGQKPPRQTALKQGGTNDPTRVKQLQALLTVLNIGGGGVDGQFGSATEAGVMDAQRKLGLKPTGRASATLVRRLHDAYLLSPCVQKPVASAGFDPAELRNPDGEWSVGAEIAHALVAAVTGGGHAVAAFDDTDGVWGPEGGRVVAVADRYGDRPNWKVNGPDATGNVFTSGQARSIADGINAMVEKTRTTPVPTGPHAFDDGPIVLATTKIGDLHVTAFHDGGGDLYADGENFIQVRSGPQWQDSLSSDGDRLDVAISDAPGLATAMHEMATVSGPVTAARADDEPDAEQVVTASAGGLDVTLFSDDTLWLDDGTTVVELDRGDAAQVLASAAQVRGDPLAVAEVGDWLSVYATDSGGVGLAADDGDNVAGLTVDDEVLARLAEMLATPEELHDEPDDDEDAPAAVAAALGHDVTPGHDELHHYWTLDPRGRERWVHSPTPWTTLLALLVEHVKPPKPLEVLKKWASRWYIEVFGYSAGSDIARVKHGKPPRGDRVGPG
jgi:peptidoglycan hydrolase-like protein with peptidoglycan-binding domain